MAQTAIDSEEEMEVLNYERTVILTIINDVYEHPETNNLISPKYDIDKWRTGMKGIFDKDRADWKETLKNPTGQAIDYQFSQLAASTQSTLVIIYQSSHGYHVDGYQGIGLTQMKDGQKQIYPLMKAIEALLAGRENFYVFSVNESCREVPRQNNHLIFDSQFIKDENEKQKQDVSGTCVASYGCDVAETILDSADVSADLSEEQKEEVREEGAKQNLRRLSIAVPKHLKACYKRRCDRNMATPYCSPDDMASFACFEGSGNRAPVQDFFGNKQVKFTDVKIDQ